MKTILSLIMLFSLSQSASAKINCTEIIKKNYEASDENTMSSSSIEFLSSKDQAKERVHNSTGLRDYQKSELYDLIQNNHYLLVIQNWDSHIYGGANLILVNPKNCRTVKSVSLWTD